MHVEAVLIFVALVTALVVVIVALFLLLGAKIAGVADATFGKAVLASLACTFLTSLLSGLMSVVSLLGTAAGFLIGLLFSPFHEPSYFQHCP